MQHLQFPCSIAAALALPWRCRCPKTPPQSPPRRQWGGEPRGPQLCEGAAAGTPRPRALAGAQRALLLPPCFARRAAAGAPPPLAGAPRAQLLRLRRQPCAAAWVGAASSGRCWRWQRTPHSPSRRPAPAAPAPLLPAAPWRLAPPLPGPRPPPAPRPLAACPPGPAPALRAPAARAAPPPALRARPRPPLPRPPRQSA